jgi:uncharacterized LabA/DUF88 family protein
MQREPAIKRAVAFIDASNTRASARRAFGDAFGNFNPVALAEEVCAAQGWTLSGVSYYLGVPDVRVTEDGHYTWMKRCARWRKQGVRVFTRTLLQDDQGTAREKGIDVRLALDAVSLFRAGGYDVALIFSQDQDFSEVATELRAIAREEKRWVQIASAFPAAAPAGADAQPAGGISGTMALPLALDEFRKVLDTPENRRRIHVPAPAPQIFRQRPAETSHAVLAQADAASAPAASRRSGIGWAAMSATAYLAIAAATFVYLTWAGRTAFALPDQAIPALADHTASALVWPIYWTHSRELEELKARLPDLQAYLR